jgi:hypothetical protein
MDKPPAARGREPTNALVLLPSLATAWHSTKTRHRCGIGSFLQRVLFHLLAVSVVLPQIRRLPWRGGCWHLLYTDRVDWQGPPATLENHEGSLRRNWVLLFACGRENERFNSLYSRWWVFPQRAQSHFQWDAFIWANNSHNRSDRADLNTLKISKDDDVT